MKRSALVFLVAAFGLLGAIADAHGQALPLCTVDFDFSCPDVTTECGTTFSGGLSCKKEGLGNCYASGNKGYRLSATTPLTIELSGDLNTLRVFFAGSGGATGSMRFFDAGDNEVGQPLLTNGACDGAIMPELQSMAFSTPARRVEVKAQGAGLVWIDAFRVNPAIVVAEPQTWGTLKSRFE